MNESVRARTRERRRKKNSASSQSNCQNNPEMRVKHYTFALRLGIYFESNNRKSFDSYLILLHVKPSIVNMAFGVCLIRPW